MVEHYEYNHLKGEKTGLQKVKEEIEELKNILHGDALKVITARLILLYEEQRTTNDLLRELIEINKRGK